MRIGPETEAWHKVALRLGMSVREAQSRMTSVEFVRWHHFFRKWDEEELNNPSKLDHYLSEILAQLERIRVPKKARSVRASKWIIKFKTRSAGKRTMTREERALQSKLAWMGSAGVELPPDVIESLKKRKDLDGR